MTHVASISDEVQFQLGSVGRQVWLSAPVAFSCGAEASWAATWQKAAGAAIEPSSFAQPSTRADAPLPPWPRGLPERLGSRVGEVCELRCLGQEGSLDA